MSAFRGAFPAMAPMRKQFVVSQNRKISRVVKDVLQSRVEHKRSTAVVAVADFATTGTIVPITQNIAQGDDISNRSGDVILLENLHIRATLKNTNANTFYSARVIIFYDSMDTLAAPAVTDVLQTADNLSGYSTISRQANRFKILYDHEFGMTPLVTPSSVTIIDRQLRVNKKIHYVAASGGNSNGRNSVYALFISDAASAGQFTYRWSYDMQYTDS